MRALRVVASVLAMLVFGGCAEEPAPARRSFAQILAEQSRLAPLPGPSRPLVLRPSGLQPRPSTTIRPLQPTPVPAPTPAPAPAPSPTPAVAPECAAFVLPQDTIFPAMQIALASAPQTLARSPQQIGDGALIGVALTAPADGVPVRVDVGCDELMEPSSCEGTLARSGQPYIVLPKLRWRFANLLQRRQAMPVNLTFRIRVGSAPVVEQVRTCEVRGINDCPTRFVVDGDRLDTSFVFAAYVNEDHPWVDGLLRDALATRVVDRFTGYQIKDPDIVLQQVAAVWRALQERGIHYSSITNVAAVKDGIGSQHVRFLDECIQNQQANCIDGTVMMASVLRKIGLHASIVLVPEHAFLAFTVDAEGTTPVGLETTILGRARKLDFDTGADPRARTMTFAQASQQSFEEALKAGSDRLAKDSLRFSSLAPADASFLVLDVDGARKLGVRPIPFAAGQGLPVPVPGPGQPEQPKLLRIR